MKLTEAIKPFYSAVALLILLTVSVFLYQKPYYNWDMFPYMALAIEDSNVPFDSVHASVYDQASVSMPASDFNAISARQPVLQEDANAFHEILRYYKIKPGYNFLVRAFHGLGVNLVSSTYLPSILCYFVIGCTMLMWLHRMIGSPFSQITALVLMASPFLVTTARFSSPDMLCAALCFVGIFLIMESTAVLGVSIFLVGIIARPDVSILYFLICIALFKTRKLNGKQTTLFLLAGIAIVLLIIKSPELIKEYLYTTADYSSSWKPNEMIFNYGVSLRGGFTSVLSSQIILFTTLAAITFYLRKRAGQEFLKDQWSLILMAAIASIVVRYFFHPVIEDRFLIGSYLIIMMGFCVSMASSLRLTVNR